MIQSSYNNLETQEAFDIYTSYTQILSQDDSFFDAQQTFFDQHIVLNVAQLRD